MRDGEAERLTEPASAAPQLEGSPRVSLRTVGRLASVGGSLLSSTSSGQLQRQGSSRASSAGVMLAGGTAEDIFDKSLRYEMQKVMTWEKFKTLWLELLGDVATDEVVQTWEEVQEFGALAQLWHLQQASPRVPILFLTEAMRCVPQLVLTRQLARQ
jgi:hypothetical protein